ncbi:hypothetical protein PIB30_018593 [Stylosanthes scabra]|uniref:Uncharacterized protein n=1 Tax=Stylosanthes scabra TaxID=79078 RepID=A0ABU6S8B3_9FABA|nr:hypothetical protein [Stylosanthes scabra]
MKRKKWSEQEEQTLLSKYSELLRSGTLAKLKTREKKFKPVAEHVNSLHHHRDPSAFPFTWSWRDVSIKVQNMRHQYLGVKQKIQALSPHSFNWSDGLNHWENFLYYKEVFGDIPSSSSIARNGSNSAVSLRSLGFSGSDDDIIDDDDECDEDEEEYECGGDDFDDDSGEEVRRIGGIGVRFLELREAVVKREERRREREFRREREEAALEREREKRRREEDDRRVEVEVEFELEERRLRWARREVARRERLERELEEERWRRKRAEERMEEEEMEWRERMVAMQVEHEKQMMQMHVDACQNQMQILGIMARILCQFFGSGTDGLGGGGGGGSATGSGLGALPSQVLQNLQHTDGLGNVKPDANSPSEFM